MSENEEAKVLPITQLNHPSYDINRRPYSMTVHGIYDEDIDYDIVLYMYDRPLSLAVRRKIGMKKHGSYDNYKTKIRLVP